MITTHQHSEVCAHTLTVNAVLQFDPTRTTVLRNAFVADMKRRFNWLTQLIVQAIVDQDVFGLVEPRVTLFVKRIPIPNGSIPGYREFQFLRSSEKVSTFMNWLEQQQAKGILQVSRLPQVGVAIEQAWTDLYIEDSYKRGVIRARYEMGKAGFPVPTLESTGGIGASMSTPFHIDRVGLMFTRTFQELKGITAAMDSQISRILAQGIADGDGPRVLARKLVKTITGPLGDLGITDTLGRFIPARRRAMTMARTEIIRAHHSAMIQEYKNFGIEGVQVKAEWATAGFRVCAECEALEGNVFTLDVIQGMIPKHPNCRCIALPVTVSEGPIRKERFTPSEDIAGAEDFAIQQGFAKNVDYRKATINEANLVNKTLHKIHRGQTLENLSFENLVNGITDARGVYIGQSNTLILKTGQPLEASARAIARNSPTFYKDKVLRLKRELLQDPENTWIKDQIKHLSKMKRVNVAYTLDEVLINEYGHKLDWLNKLSVSSEFDTITAFERLWKTNQTTILKQLKGEANAKIWIQENLSEYALTNRKELFAEAYLSKLKGEAQPKWLTDMINKIIRDAK